MKVVLSNAAQPAYGVANIPLPIPKAEYDHCIFILNALEIGNQLTTDCKVEEISADTPILQRLVGSSINIDELDYLVKRMESFDKRELAQFSAVAISQDIHEIKDLINLTFCCQDVPIVQDFTDLEKVGRFYHMDRNGGVLLPAAENLDFKNEALKLLLNEEGKVTRYGVIYDSGFQLEQLYDGQHFPQYRYEDCVMEVEVCTVDNRKPTFLCLPMSELQLERAMQRGECQSTRGMQLRFLDSSLPEEADAVIDFEQTGITELNNLCQTVSAFSDADIAKLGAVVAFAKPSDTTELWHLAEQLDLFDFVPGISSAKEYGKHMEQEQGKFNHRGYVSYQGFISMEEVLADIPSERLEQSTGGM